METTKDSGKYDIKGGKTILGKIFAYQERTGASLEEIRGMSWVQFVLGMADAPNIDYESKKDVTKKDKPDGKAAEKAALLGFFK